MKVVIHENPDLSENHVIINCRKTDVKIRRLESFIKRLSIMMNVVSEGDTYRISADDIMYIESVDRRTFFYTHEKIYENRDPLYQLETQLHNTGIIRISKNCLLNVNHLKSICPYTNHRFEATLANGEKMLVSRNYISDLKKELER